MFRKDNLIIVQITGEPNFVSIAKVLVADPLTIKITEKGPLSKLQNEDFIVLENYTNLFQKDKEKFVINYEVSSGLVEFGANNDNSSLFEIKVE